MHMFLARGALGSLTTCMEGAKDRYG